MSKQRTDKAYGPYEHGKQWRIVIVTADGTKRPCSFKTFKEADEYKASFASVTSSRSIGQAVEEYLVATKSDKDASNVAKRARLVAMFRLPKEDRLLVSINTAIAKRLYARRVEECAAATHHNELGYARTFFKWCLSQGWLRYNPWLEVQPVGTPNRGKPKLRINDSRKFFAALVGDVSVQSSAVMTAFLLGMRATEVIDRRVKDLDDDGRLFWITEAKSRAGDREIEIPEVLRQRLLLLAQGKDPEDYLYGTMTRQTLWQAVKVFAKRAGVPDISPHGLRGSALTKRVRNGGSIEEVAEYAGHADAGKTLRGHYLAPGAVESARGKQLVELLRSPGASDDQLEAFWNHDLN
jgi:integrase